MMNLNALKIDPEFQGKIPPLNFEEEQQLEQNILHEGRLLNPHYHLEWLYSGRAYPLPHPAEASVHRLPDTGDRSWITVTRLFHGSARTSLDAEILTRNGRSF